MDHFCKYQPEFRVKERKYDSTNTFVIETTSVCVQACFICKKIKPKTPTDEFVSIRINYDDELILGYEIFQICVIIQFLVDTTFRCFAVFG